MGHSLKMDDGDTWLELTESPLTVGVAYDWAVVPRCGAVVVFSGTVRDHAEGRNDVTALDYEAYDGEVLPRLAEIVSRMRERWKSLGRIALIHRVGILYLGESSVLVVVSAPHRPDAFAAAQFGIDSLKSTVPIWKREKWADGDDWGTGGRRIADLKDIQMAEQEGAQQ
ncbi:MAG: molybdenum cofactor biosynthesis protein MoaE [Actinomycetota bacterium]